MKRVFVFACFLVFILNLPADKPGQVIQKIQLDFKSPSGLAFDGKNLWVSDLDSAMLYSIDPKSGSIISKILSPGYNPSGLSFDGKKIWCMDKADKTLYAVVAEKGLTVKSLVFEDGNIGAPCHDGKNVWVVDTKSNMLFYLDENDGTTLRNIPSPSNKGEITAIVFDGKMLWLSDRIRNMIYQVYPATGDIVNMFPSPGPYPSGLAWDGFFLWCLDFETKSIYKISTRCDGDYMTTDSKREKMRYVESWMNLGPGTVKTMDIFIAVPVDLPNQKLESEITYIPKPTDFITDQWEQKFAHFGFENIGAGQVIEAKMEVEATLSKLRYFIDPERVGSFDEIPPEIKKPYLVDEVKLDIKNPLIQNAVKEAVGSEKNPYWVARKINKYIQEKMHYELSGGWDSAPLVLKRGSGSCSEYSFVAISMLRASGIPARYAGSVVIRSDDASIDDVFHRWVEFYLPRYGWIPFDPSGGDDPDMEAQARYFGGLDNRYLITTIGGGNSKFIGWDYNSSEVWTFEGRCKLLTKRFGQWSPVGKKYEEGKEASEAKTGGGTCEPIK